MAFLPKAILLFAPLTLVAYAQDVAGETPKDRSRRAQALGEQGSTALPALQAMLKDSDSGVRLEAVKSIVKIGTQHSLSPLIEATLDADPEIQIRATDGLVDFYYPGYVKTGLSGSLSRLKTSLKGQFTDVNDQVIPLGIEVRTDVVEALGKLARGGSTMMARANAARAIGVLRGQAAMPDLLDAVRSKDSRLIYESLIAIQKIRDPSAAPRISFLLRDLDNKVQIAAIETTGLLGNREALPQLRDALDNARNKEVRRAALTAIAMLPDPQNLTLYDRYLTDKDGLTRAAAFEGIARLRNPADLPRLESLFQAETKMNPRLSLAFALVMLGKVELSEFSPLQYLVNTLNSSSYNGVAEPFLIELAREPAVRTSLYQALPSGTRDEKIGLARVLARSGDAESIPHLEQLSRDADSEVALQAAGALRALRGRL
ncbi:MAG: HEAT repeat domain-containing protein [Bryobacteraceae bacterium]|nr:HEAT repeat domain-containing protein [Bryobacteraceae bacterium]